MYLKVYQLSTFTNYNLFTFSSFAYSHFLEDGSYLEGFMPLWRMRRMCNKRFNMLPDMNEPKKGYCKTFFFCSEIPHNSRFQ